MALPGIGMSPFALCPAMSGDAALASALLSPIGTRDGAVTPGSPVQPKPFHYQGEAEGKKSQSVYMEVEVGPGEPPLSRSTTTNP